VGAKHLQHSRGDKARQGKRQVRQPLPATPSPPSPLLLSAGQNISLPFGDSTGGKAKTKRPYRKSMFVFFTLLFQRERVLSLFGRVYISLHFPLLFEKKESNLSFPPALAGGISLYSAPSLKSILYAFQRGCYLEQIYNPPYRVYIYSIGGFLGGN
jgi:hypothetical protein